MRKASEMEDYIIGIDNGGTYIKAALFDGSGRQVLLEKEPSVVVAAKGARVELDQEQLWEANCRCVSRLIKNSRINPSAVNCIGVAGQGKGLYTIDKEGKSIRKAITSADGRAWEYINKWHEDGTADKIFEYTYQDLFTSHPVSILAWLKDHERENYNQIKWIFSMKDFLVYRMTGMAVADYCNQSGGSFMNLNNGKYEPQILSILEIPEVLDKLPTLSHSDEICGTVTKAAAAKLGCAEGTKVITGMFDVDASGLAMGIIDEKYIGIVTGTCGINAYIATEPVRNHSILMNSYYCIPGYYFIEEGSNTSAGVLEWAIRMLYTEGEKEDIYSHLNQIVVSLIPESSDVVFLPFLYGSALNSKSKGVWLGMSPVDTKENLIRAVYEGVVFSHKWHINRLLKNRDKPNVIRMAGGAVNSEVWTQMFADILQIPIELVEGPELGVKGVAIAAGIAVGLYENYYDALEKTPLTKRSIYPNVKLADVYNRKYERYLSAMESLDGTWKLF